MNFIIIIKEIYISLTLFYRIIHSVFGWVSCLKSFANGYKYRLVLLSFIFCLHPVYAADWIVLGQNERGDTVAIDSSSVSVVDMQTKAFSGRLQLAVPAEDGSGIDTMVMTAMIQCNTQVVEIHELDYFSSIKNQLVDSKKFIVPVFQSIDLEKPVDLKTYQLLCLAE